MVITDDEAGVANIAGGDVVYTFTFSETVTGFIVGDVTVVGGIKGAFSGSGAVYTLAVTPATSSVSNITVDVAASVAIDGNSNNNTIATQSVQVVDTLRPTLSPVSISSNNASSTLAKVGNVITLTFTSSESVSTPTVTISGQSASVLGTTTGWTATYTMQSTNSEGIIPLTINVTDLNSNTGVQVSTTTNLSKVIFDKTIPTIVMNGFSPVEISKNSSYTDLGATATDTRDGTITSSIATTSTVTTQYVGTYYVTYEVADAAGNSAIAVSREVKVRNSSGGGNRSNSITTVVQSVPLTSLVTFAEFETMTEAQKAELIASIQAQIVELLKQLLAQLQAGSRVQ